MIYFLVILSFLFPNSTESHILLNIIRQKNASTKWINDIRQYQSTFSTDLRIDKTTLQANTIFPSLITKPNSYLYDPDDDDDDDILSNRVKRDTAPFVCKGKTLNIYLISRCF
jgi:hypothetical protein